MLTASQVSKIRWQFIASCMDSRLRRNDKIKGVL